MENFTEYSKWIYAIIFIAFNLYALYLISHYKLKKLKKEYITANDRKAELREQITKINRSLLETGMDYEAILDFWEECLAEAQIQYNLPPCSCGDVNQCETWCRAKARFTLNPPCD